MKINVAGIQNDSIVDGPGIRFALFVQGCPHHCDGCHNPETWEFGTGTDMTTEEIFEKITEDPLLDGVTFSGGEPFCQCHALAELADMIRLHEGLDLMSYTGFRFEYLIEHANEENGYMKLLGKLDYLVDGRFVKELKSYELKFKGSSNQRFIDVKRSLKEGRAVEAEDPWDDIKIRLI